LAVVPAFSEIEDGTAQIEKIPGVNELFMFAPFQEISLVPRVGLNYFKQTMTPVVVFYLMRT
jgi:hypothetical protein